MQKFLWKIGICFSLVLSASNMVFAITLDEIVKNFRVKYEKTNNFSANFEETTIVAGRKHVGAGYVSFQKPNLLYKRNVEPANPDQMTQLIVSDGKTVWSYTPLIKQVTRQKLAQDEENMELLPGFGRSLENVEKNYSLSFVEDKLAEKGGVHVIQLVPKKLDENSIFDVMQVWIRDADSVPVQFMYKSKRNEMTFILSFKEVKLNEKLDESTFKFEVPTGVQVITAPD